MIGHPCTTWSDGHYIVIAAGEGAEGATVSDKILANCALPAFAKKSQLLGSINDLEKKAARGITDQTFVLISREPSTRSEKEHAKLVRRNFRQNKRR